jgi:hypothetical protein
MGKRRLEVAGKNTGQVKKTYHKKKRKRNSKKTYDSKLSSPEDEELQIIEGLNHLKNSVLTATEGIKGTKSIENRDRMVGSHLKLFDSIKNHRRVRKVEILKKAGSNEFSAKHSSQDILNEVLQIYKSPYTFKELNILKQIFTTLLYVAANIDDLDRDSQYVNKALLFLSALFLQHNLPFQQGALFKLILLAAIVTHVNMDRYHTACKEIVRSCLLLVYHEMKSLIISSQNE